MLLEQKTTDFLEQLSSSAPIPGGGGASAAVGAFASALGLMVTNLTVGKKKYADVEEEILEIREKLEQKKQDLVRMVDEDAEAFEPLAKAYRMPKETEEEQAEKEKVMDHENNCRYYGDDPGAGGKRKQACCQRCRSCNPLCTGSP